MRKMTCFLVVTLAVLILGPARPAYAIFGSEVCDRPVADVAGLIGQPGDALLYPRLLRDSGHPKAEKLCLNECKASGKLCGTLIKLIAKCKLTQTKIETATDIKNFGPADFQGDKAGQKAYAKMLKEALKATTAQSKANVTAAIGQCTDYVAQCSAMCTGP